MAVIWQDERTNMKVRVGAPTFKLSGVKVHSWDSR
jgi:hypothetical protein